LQCATSAYAAAGEASRATPAAALPEIDVPDDNKSQRARCAEVFEATKKQLLLSLSPLD
jgi:hypothetical protein